MILRRSKNLSKVRDLTEITGNIFSRDSGKRKFIEDLNGCYLWLGGVCKDGYAQVSYKGKTNRASRLVYAVCNGPIPSGSVIRHKCDVQACINPKHLLSGTQQDNIDDKVKRNRQTSGERHHRAKLNFREVASLRKMYKDGIHQTELAFIFSISQTQVSRIVTHTTWK